MKSDAETALTIVQISKELSTAWENLEKFVESEELPLSERDYYKAKEIACEVLKSEGKTVGEVTVMIKGRCSDELYRFKCAKIKFTALRDRTSILEKQLNAYQSVNKKFSMV